MRGNDVAGSHQEPLSRRLLAAVAAPFGRVPKPPRRPGLRWTHWAFCLAGLAIGLLWALPLEDVTSRCPAPGEGLVQCQIQKSVLPAVMEVIGCFLAGHFLFTIAFEHLPRLIRAHRAGERWSVKLRSRRPAPPRPDPVLLAATWGTVEGGEDGPAPAAETIDPDAPPAGTLAALVDNGSEEPVAEEEPRDRHQELMSLLDGVGRPDRPEVEEDEVAEPDPVAEPEPVSDPEPVAEVLESVTEVHELVAEAPEPVAEVSDLEPVAEADDEMPAPEHADPPRREPLLPVSEPLAEPADILAAATRGHIPGRRLGRAAKTPRLPRESVPTFCRHNRFAASCPICSQDHPELAEPSSPARPRTRSGGGTATRRRGATSMRVRRSERPVADGYTSTLVPGLRATPDARRLADELAFAAGRLVELEEAPSGLYAEIAESPAADEALWLAFLTAYLSPTEDDDPFAAIRHARTYWSTGALPDLDGVATGPRTAHDPARGTETLAAYRAWAERSGGQLAGLTGEPGWTPERRFERAFERLSLPGFHRAARMDFLGSVGRLGVIEMTPASLHLQGSDPTTIAAKRVFGIGDPMLLQRRAATLAEATGVPIEALELALYNWTSDERATLGVAADAADRVDRTPIDAALGVDDE